MEERFKAWQLATQMVGPIIEEYGVEPYRVNGGPFNTGTTMTKVDQTIDSLIRVADWLLEGNNG